MNKRAIKKASATAPETITEDPELAKQRVDAFSAEEEQWNGQTLQPYTSSREVLFEILRGATNAPPLALTCQSIDAFFPDAIRILYLCSHTPDDWRHLRNTPQEWQEKIEEWADTAVPLARKGEAVNTAMRVWNRGYANEHIPVARTGRTPGAKK
jgi:hypothetical protein